ncbi:MAG TPA: glycosyltransferase family 2 protein [Candidatus Omnitrophota bacterium]|nr:glycosyltransferase family 2 protein [Candidatus Omnitrophota bacterium]HPD84876.1 glycosyltransferase family 2 protein [Candidatus Omnitrophota bacterium]HRZ03734.1 glycosyltransferase family 2 protein [Candidatus Omnitrophota bacterium]
MKEYDISVVIPAHNEEGNLMPLFQRLNKALSEFGRSFQIVFVNDGSTDDSEKVLEEIQRNNSNITVINFFKKMGKALALEQGFELVKGQYVVVIDSDLQHDPEDVPKLVKKMDEGFDVVSGKRVNRQDEKRTILTSRLFNWLMRLITGLKFEDYFSGLKCFRMNVIQYLALYGDLYRFAAAFAHRNGFRVTEIPVVHRPRFRGISKYNFLGRLQRAIDDLIIVFFSVTFSRERAYYLGMMGLLLLSAGVAFVFMAFLIFGIQETAFRHSYMTIGVVMIFIGLELAIFKRIADNFFARHQEERLHRKRNIKNILRCN